MNAVAGKHVVVTGRIVGESRQTAEAKLRAAGAHVQSAVTGATDLLICGDAVGKTKTDKARKLGVTVTTWSEAMNGGSADADPPLPPAPKTSVFAVKQIKPMLAQKADEPPQGEHWAHEIKWDGFRCIAHCTSEGVILRSRSGKPLSFPGIEKTLEPFKDVILDGEAIVLDTKGRGDFGQIGDGATNATYAVFDLLQLGGIDARQQTWTKRRELLESMLDVLPDEAWKYVVLSPAYEDGAKLLALATKRGDEGIVSKRRTSTYQEGSRGEAWRKVKVRNVQEFVAVGWTDGENSNVGHVGAIALGYYEDGLLVYAGKVGTGFSLEDTEWLMAEPSAEAPEAMTKGDARDRALVREVHWIKPTAVAQIAYQRWTDDERLWHPSFKGWREDKKPAEVGKEG